MNRRRGTTIRDKHRAILRQGEPPCSLCGQQIDYQLRYPDPGCYVVDHVIPLARGGSDTLDNKAPAHRACNSAKYTKLVDDPFTRESPSTPAAQPLCRSHTLIRPASAWYLDATLNLIDDEQLTARLDVTERFKSGELTRTAYATAMHLLDAGEEAAR